MVKGNNRQSCECSAGQIMEAKVFPETAATIRGPLSEIRSERCRGLAAITEAVPASIPRAWHFRNDSESPESLPRKVFEFASALDRLFFSHCVSYLRTMCVVRAAVSADNTARLVKFYPMRVEIKPA